MTNSLSVEKIELDSKRKYTGSRILSNQALFNTISKKFYKNSGLCQPSEKQFKAFYQIASKSAYTVFKIGPISLLVNSLSCSKQPGSLETGKFEIKSKDGTSEFIITCLEIFCFHQE